MCEWDHDLDDDDHNNNDVDDDDHNEHDEIEPRETVESELKTANQQQALGIAILLLVLIISPIIIFLVRCGLLILIVIPTCYHPPPQERHRHHPHLLSDPLHQGAGAGPGEAEDGRPSLPDPASTGHSNRL